MRKLLILIVVILGGGALTAQQMKFTGNEIVTGQGLKFSGMFVEGTAGQALDFGDLCYYEGTDGKYYDVDEDIDSTQINYYVMVVDSAIVQDDVGRFLYLGIAQDTSWAYTAKDSVFISATAGETETSGDVFVGIAQDTVTLFFNGGLD